MRNSRHCAVLAPLLCCAAAPALSGRKLDARFLFHASQNLVPCTGAEDHILGAGVTTPSIPSVRTTRFIGREVAHLVNQPGLAGRHSVTFDGHGLAGGVHLCRLEAGGQVRARTIMHLE